VLCWCGPVACAGGSDGAAWQGPQGFNLSQRRFAAPWSCERSEHPGFSAAPWGVGRIGVQGSGRLWRRSPSALGFLCRAFGPSSGQDRIRGGAGESGRVDGPADGACGLGDDRCPGDDDREAGGGAESSQREVGADGRGRRKDRLEKTTTEILTLRVRMALPKG